VSTTDLATADDEALVAAFVAGDERAFDVLVDRYERRVFAICYRYFGNAADAEDAAQDAFVALLRRAETFSGASSFSTWMYRVATNACNDLARKRARRPQRDGTDVGELMDRTQGAGSPEEHLAATGLDPELVAALRQLDDATREAIVLHDVYAVPYVDIAARAGVAVGTVKSRIHRGHARLAALLRDAGSTEPSRAPRPPTSRHD
jgi:RNA polymerase sigma-70 factor, ECF subfamily